MDGVYSETLSDGLFLDGAVLELISTTEEVDIHWAKSLYGSLEKNGQTPVARPLAAFNSAFAGEGILLHVKETLSKPISLHYIHGSETSDVILHHVIKVDAGALQPDCGTFISARRFETSVSFVWASDIKRPPPEYLHIRCFRLLAPAPVHPFSRCAHQP